MCNQNTNEKINYDVIKIINNRYGHINSITDLEKVINKIIKDKSLLMKNISSSSFSDNDKKEVAVLENITEYLVNDIVKYKNTNKRQAIYLFCIIRQYAGASTIEIATNQLNILFYNNINLVIDVLSTAHCYLLPEFNNNDYLFNLYWSVCQYPIQMKEKNSTYDIQKENRNIRNKLLAMRNNKNKEVIKYLLRYIYNEK